MRGICVFDDVGKQFIGNVEKQFGFFLGEMVQLLDGVNYLPFELQLVQSVLELGDDLIEMPELVGIVGLLCVVG